MLKGKIDTKSVRKLKWLFKEMKMDNALTKINSVCRTRCIITEKDKR